MTDYLTTAIMRDLFKGPVYCGPDLDKKAYFPNIVYGVSKFIPDQVPLVIPDQFYHPEVKIAIDFTHQFTMNIVGGPGSEEILEAKRPVSQNTLKSVAENLAKFIAYYFEYVLSFGKEKFLSSIQAYDFSVEKDANVFLNTVLNWFVTQVSTDRSRTSIGRSSIILRDNPNRNNVGKNVNIFLDKTRDILDQILSPMLPIMIWARGRLYKDWYFPIFDGYLMQANMANSQGFTNISINGLDSLELARISQEMINPSIIQLKELRQQTSVNIWAQPLYGLDHTQIFNTMFRGGKVVYVPGEGGRLLNDNDLPVLSELGWGKGDTEKNQYLNFSALGRFGAAGEDSKKKPADIMNDKYIHKDSFTTDRILKEVSHTLRPRYTSVWGEKITPYRIFNFQSPQIFTSEFSNRLDIIRNVAGMVYYELYIDGYGTVHYHPMRMSNDFLYYDIIYKNKSGPESLKSEDRHIIRFPGAQIISPEEAFDVNSSFNIEEMVTFLRLSGVAPEIGDLAQAEQLDLVGDAIAKEYMQRYGYRRVEIKNPLFNFNPSLKDSTGGSKVENIKFLDLAAYALMRYANSELYKRTANIIFRPEIELALPVYYTDDSMVFYCQSISHSITIGGDARTTVDANFGRKDRHLPVDLMNYIIDTQKMYEMKNRPTSYVLDGQLLDLETTQTLFREAEDQYSVPFKEQQEMLEKHWAEEDELESRTESKTENVEKSRRNSLAVQKRSNQKNQKEQKELEKAKDRVANLIRSGGGVSTADIINAALPSAFQPK